MIKKYKTGDYLNDGSIEERSLCLALIRQTMSGNEPDIVHLRDYPDSVFPNILHKGFFYIDYPQDRWRSDTKKAENIPDWPCLNLKPEILEEAIKNCLSQNNLQFDSRKIINLLVEVENLEDGLNRLEKLQEELNLKM